MMYGKKLLLQLTCGIIVILIVKALIKYIMTWFTGFCVFYTLSDVWKRRKIIKKYWRLGYTYGIIPDIFPKYSKIKKITKAQKS